jgi:hypothetical protein
LIINQDYIQREAPVQDTKLPEAKRGVVSNGRTGEGSREMSSMICAIAEVENRI